jgi:hypothetical protein
MAQPERKVRPDPLVRQARKAPQVYLDQLAQLARPVPVDLLERPEHRDLPGQTAPVSFF